MVLLEPVNRIHHSHPLHLSGGTQELLVCGKKHIGLGVEGAGQVGGIAGLESQALHEVPGQSEHFGQRAYRRFGDLLPGADLLALFLVGVGLVLS